MLIGGAGADEMRELMFDLYGLENVDFTIVLYMFFESWCADMRFANECSPTNIRFAHALWEARNTCFIQVLRTLLKHCVGANC